MTVYKWHSSSELESKKFTCGHCGETMVSNEGFMATGQLGEVYMLRQIYICHYCQNPSLFDFNTSKQSPGPMYGNSISHIPSDNVNNIYTEARLCFTTNSYTAVVMCGRKLLMNIAVDQGGEEGDSFKSYVDYLDAKGFIPPGGGKWVDAIRKLGNEANHVIIKRNKEEAELILKFCEMLLKFIYEIPGEMNAESGSK